jgi:5-methyltetrahydropteroyltriglutamate--homocysteine methyltransferase
MANPNSSALAPYTIRDHADDPDDLPRAYAELINSVIDGRPDDLTIAVHMCRGNFRSAWVAEGGYEPVAEILFNEMNIDAFFPEYDDERSGDFAPLRHMPKDKTVVLGLVTTKESELETQQELIDLVNEVRSMSPWRTSA